MTTTKATIIRIGALGAARITPSALLEPAKNSKHIEIKAIASRNQHRAKYLAKQYSIPKIYTSYKELLSDSKIDAVYIALPNAFHAEFIIAALKKGKHVLCEKPLVSNYIEAQFIEKESAKYSQLVVMEAHHWRYHPLAKDILKYIPKLGKLHTMQIRFAFPLLRPRDIRWELNLAGGAMMDVGCYTVSLLRMITDKYPHILTAKALTYKNNIDRRMDAELLIPKNFHVTLLASMLSAASPGQNTIVEGDKGKMIIKNPFAAHRNGNVKIILKDEKPMIIDYPAYPTTFQYQLQAFADAIYGIGPNLTPIKEAVKTLRIIDEIYKASNLTPRPSRLGSLEEFTS